MITQLDRLASADIPPDATTAYGPDHDQVYDVREPEEPRGVTALVVHGGFWRPDYDRQHATAQAAALARNGFHVAVMEYRRPQRAGWPTMRADVIAATAAVRDDSRLPCPFLTMGHSAGGHLVLWLQHQEVAAGVLGTVALAPCADLRRTHDLGLDGDAAHALMGTRPQQSPDAWREADPARLGIPPAPARLVHGDHDSRVPLEVSRAYAEIDSAHITLEVVSGADHFDLIDPDSPHFASTLAAATALAARG